VIAPGAAVPGAAEEARRAALAAFVQRQTQAAAAAEREGRWADAARALEGLAALAPADAALGGRLQRVREASESLSTLRQQQALLALQLGETDSAQQLLLRALEARPDNAQALGLLRTLEQQQQAARLAAGRGASALPAAPYRPAHEAAWLLAQQGHPAEAILALGPAVDAPTRALLARLHLQEAQALWPQEAARALASLRRSAQLDRQNAQTARLLRAWERELRSGRASPTPPPPEKGAARNPGASTP
jgi:tetratricopeptide (TPR) repeat protein